MGKRYRDSSFPELTTMATLAKRMRCVGVEPKNWLHLLPMELIESIMKRLGLVDIVRLKAVCQSGHKAANSYLSSHPDQSPWLILPEVKEEEEESDGHYSRFINLTDEERQNKSHKLNNGIYQWLHDDDDDDDDEYVFAYQERQKSYKLKNGIYQWLDDDYDRPKCVGSSYGWLIIFDGRSHGCLLNPFTGNKIELPNTKSIKSDFDLVFKAILSSDPSSSSTKTFTIVIFFGFFRQIAFCTHNNIRNRRNKGDGSWTKFGGRCYSDTLFHDNKLYALLYSSIKKLGEKNGMVEVWDFEDYFPKKVATFKPPLPLPYQFLPPLSMFPLSQNIIYSHIYLVESLGEILYVFLVSSRSRPDRHLIKQCFHVYKLLDHDGGGWEQVENLKGQALFIGRNQSLSISAPEFPEWKENSIYISTYFPHVRVYNLDQKVLQNMVKFSHPSPFWIVPHCF